MGHPPVVVEIEALRRRQGFGLFVEVTTEAPAIHRQSLGAHCDDLDAMRTTIEIGDELIRRVMRRYALPTKRAAVDLALRRLDLDPITRAEILEMRGTGWDGDLAALREGNPLLAWSSSEVDTAS